MGRLQNMKKKSRIIAAVWIAFCLTALLFSCDSFTENIHHSCIGENCFTCFKVQVAKQILSGFKLISFLPYHRAVLCISICFYLIFKQYFWIKNTLISLKVELLN